MKNRHCAIAQCVLPGLLLLSFFSACSSPQKRLANSSRDHAFIVYWPPPENSKQLRLAVKDLIDMKGVVTTAGSEYLAKTSPPASQDAQCLELARERNVQMGFEQYHEPADELPPKTRTFARMIVSLTEEAEAINWYEQRMALEKDKSAHAIMGNAQKEEFKHFSMDLEWLLRAKPIWREIAQGILFTEGDIVKRGEKAEEKA